MASRPFETRSLVGCSAAALVDRAPEADPPEPPADGVKPAYDRTNVISRPPAKPGDEIKPGTCKRCGYVPSKWVGEHATPEHCISELRWQIALLGFHPATNPGPKRRAASR